MRVEWVCGLYMICLVTLLVVSSVGLAVIRPMHPFPFLGYSISKSSVNFSGCAVRLLAVLLCTVSSLLACLFISILIYKWNYTPV